MNAFSDSEFARVKRLQAQAENIDLLERMSIERMAQIIQHAKACVTVDTGFGHIAGALNVPTIGLYGATNPEYTGVMGVHAKNLLAKYSCVPCLNRECKLAKETHLNPLCFSTLPPELVWQELQALMQQA